jgi:hypothetical protein
LYFIEIEKAGKKKYVVRENKSEYYNKGNPTGQMYELSSKLIAITDKLDGYVSIIDRTLKK